MKGMIVEQLKKQLIRWLTRKTLKSAVRRVGELPLTIGSDIGSKRNENQDRVAVLKIQLNPNQSIIVAALCDGMGGMTDGSVCAAHTLASFLAACCTSDDIAPKERVMSAAHEANRVVHSLYCGKGGSTLSAVLFDSKKGMIGVNVGDSRIYSFQDRVLSQVTIDDTISGLLPKSDHNISSRNELLQFVGIGENLDPHLIELNEQQELIVLTSDGVHFLEKDLLQMVIRTANDQGLATKRIIEISQWCSGHDNASIIIAAPHNNTLLKLEETEVVQVWDPYGELQLIIAGPTGLPQKNEPVNKPSPMIERQKSPKKATSSKRDKAKSSKQKKSEVDVPPKRSEEAKNLEPQLKILFDINNNETPND